MFKKYKNLETIKRKLKKNTTSRVIKKSMENYGKANWGD